MTGILKTHTHTARLVGFGLDLHQEWQNDERLTFVEQITPGCAAHKSGQIMVNFKDHPH